MISNLELYTKIAANGGELNGDWVFNTPVNAGLVKQFDTRESLVSEFTARMDFSIDGVVRWQGVGNCIQQAIDWLTSHYPDVKYSPISKYFDPLVVQNGLSVNHCFVNIMRSRVNSFYPLETCKSILEIGAGYGAFARELIWENNKIKYVIIDLPESLMCSYSYLSLEFPDKKHLILTGEEDTNKEWDILYITPTLIDLSVNSKMISEFDLFINTQSMGEITNNVVKRYYHLVSKVLKVKAAYTVNRYLNDGDAIAKQNENYCTVGIPQEWHVKCWNYPPAWTDCPVFMKWFAKCVELYAEIKTTPDSLQSSIDKSNVLFHLWNAVRLQPTIPSVKAIIEHIKSVNPTAIELIHYVNLLEALYKFWSAVKEINNLQTISNFKF